MRHGKKINHLGRTAPHRKAMLANMACSLIEHKRINTTVAKAKALRVYVEPLLTKAKEDTTHNRRTVFSYLQSKEAVTELFRTVAHPILMENSVKNLNALFPEAKRAKANYEDGVARFLCEQIV